MKISFGIFLFSTAREGEEKARREAAQHGDDAPAKRWLTTGVGTKTKGRLNTAAYVKPKSL